jgi:hypothetical protein
MGRRTTVGGAAALAVLLATTGCGLFNRTVRETPEQLAVRTLEVDRIRAEPSLAAARLRVAVQPGGEVALYGSIPGFGALRCAVTNAELVQGVTLVIDHVVLDPGPVEARCLAPRVFPSAARVSLVKT